MAFKADDAAVYLTDNGRALCGEHLGQTAKATGRDISGQKIMVVAGPMLGDCAAIGFVPACEQCGKKPQRGAR